jgi:restriction system protein
MAKKKDIVQILADQIIRLPWWVDLALAVISFVLLHRVASAPVAPVQPGQFGAAVTQGLFKGYAMLGQTIVPAIFIFGALLSVWIRRRRERLFSDASAGNAVAVISKMSWREFEMLVGEAFRRSGYAVSENGLGGADGGIDLILHKDNEKYLVQCKQWRARNVGVKVIRELYGVMAADGAVGGFVVTSGYFTQEAKIFAKGRNIDLIDGVELMAIIKTINPPSISNEETAHFTPSEETVQTCPKCGASMVKRTAKQGSNPGGEFWGCSQFPRCRGTVSIE